jgi:hypothetical protein
LYFVRPAPDPFPPSTPVFSAAYSAQGDKKQVQVIFVSSDEDEDAFNEYFGEHPWAAVPYGEASREALGETYGVSVCIIALLLWQFNSSPARSSFHALCLSAHSHY